MKQHLGKVHDEAINDFAIIQCPECEDIRKIGRYRFNNRETDYCKRCWQSVPGEANPPRERKRKEIECKECGDTEEVPEWYERETDLCYDCSRGVVGQTWVREYEVEETGHTVSGTWERDTDLALHVLDINFEYEPEKFSLPSLNYIPDFIVEDQVVIEVKGRLTENAHTKANEFMEEYPQYEYWVIGNGEVQYDKWIQDWSSVRNLANQIEDRL